MTYDYAIVGAGAAGLQLALAMGRDPFFVGKEILLIDKDTKTQNDKTWCYWERGSGHYDKIISKKWHEGSFISSQVNLNLNLSPYTYKMLRSIDFYDHARAVISKHSNFYWVKDNVVSTEEEDVVILHGEKEKYQAGMVFDSRLENGPSVNSITTIYQHFKGWVIDTKVPFFDEERFTIMDFRLKWKDDTSFSYVLPLSSTKALVEFTLFTPYLIESISYDAMLLQYVEEVLGLKDYEINGVEKGVIPMTTYPFHIKSTGSVIKIGTAGSWVKPSSGYSFKFSQKKSEEIINTLKRNKPLTPVLSKRKYQFYDKLLLDVLEKDNVKGERIFSDMYAHNKPSSILKFLDEDTSLWEDIRIISSLPKKPFLSALKRHWTG